MRAPALAARAASAGVARDGEFAGEPLEQRARAHRLDEPAVETAQANSDRRRGARRAKTAPGSWARPRARAALASRLVASTPSAQSTITRSGAGPACKRGRALLEPFGAADLRAGIAQQRRQRRRLERRIGDDQRPAPLEIDGPQRRLSGRRGRRRNGGAGRRRRRSSRRPGLSRSVSSPPISATSRLEIARPRPVPSKWRACEPSPCSKSSKIEARRSAGTPGPVSVTSKESLLAGERVRQQTPTPPRAVNLTALPARLVSAWRRRRLSPTTSAGASAAIEAAISRPFALRVRREQLDDLLDQPARIERLLDQFQPARLDLGEIENLIDQARQRGARSADRLDIARRLGLQRRRRATVRPCRECRAAACGFRGSWSPGSATWPRSPPRRVRARRRPPSGARPRRAALRSASPRAAARSSRARRRRSNSIDHRQRQREDRPRLQAPIGASRTAFDRNRIPSSTTSRGRRNHRSIKHGGTRLKICCRRD